MEEWRPVVGQCAYEVSSEGRIRRCAPGHRQGVGRGRVGYILRPSVSRFGYYRIELLQFGRRYKLLVHRLVAEAFLGPRPEHLEVNHKNGNKLDNRPDNLEYVTRSQNMLHAFATGLKKRGFNGIPWWAKEAR